jgi:hypothetical protein
MPLKRSGAVALRRRSPHLRAQTSPGPPAAAADRDSASGCPDGSFRPRILADILAALVLAAVTVVLYRRITSLWWTMDDAYQLHILTDHPHLAYLRPSVWQALGAKIYTPLLLVSLGVDRHLAGYDPSFFYVHQVISLALASLAAYGMFRLWWRPAFAFGASLLLIAGTPFCTIAQQLMLRHYVEGFVLAAVAVAFFVLAVRRRRLTFELASAAAYLLAMLAKEIYVPLPLVLLLLPESGPRARAWRLRAHAAALIVYLALRHLNLGTLLGGYGWVVEANELPRVAVAFAANMARQLFGGPATMIPLAGAAVVSLVLLARHRPRFVPAFVLLFLAAFGPVLPVAKAQEARYGLGVWILVAVVIATAAALVDREGRRTAGAVLLGIATAATLIANRAAWNPAFAAAERMSAEGRWFLDARQGELLRNPAVPPSAMGEFAWLKTVLQKPAGAAWFYDDVYLCESAGSGAIFEYQPATRRVAEVTEQVRRELPRTCEMEKATEPLWAHFRYARGVLRWRLGPYSAGQYRFLIANGIQSFDVPREEGFQLPGDGLTLRIVHVDPDGHRVYSPPVPLDFINHPVTDWQR